LFVYVVRFYEQGLTSPAYRFVAPTGLGLSVRFISFGRLAIVKFFAKAKNESKAMFLMTKFPIYGKNE
jgi:hypothetical protein